MNTETLLHNAEAEIERLKKENESVMKHRAEAEQQWENWQCRYDETLLKLTELRQQRDSFKTIAEEAVATVKEQDEELKKSKVAVKAAMLFYDRHSKVECEEKTNLFFALEEYDAWLRMRNNKIKDPSSIPKSESVALDRLTKEKE